jgi:hypothetical protein
MRRIGPAIMQRQGRPRFARVAGLAADPLHGMTSYGEKYLMPLASPARTRKR